jgi:hypothetical protein
MHRHPLYQLEKSPLYRLRNKTKLAKLLQISKDELINLSETPTYRIFIRKEKKDRQIEEPVGKLKTVHKLLQIYFSRIQSPDYLFSGKRKTTYIDNARLHIYNKYVLTLDVEKFYPTTKIEYIFRFYRNRLMMSEDIAWLLSRIVTYQGHIPTGSHLSQSLAYWSYSQMFDEIDKLAHERGFLFSLYVDDITFSSSSPIPRSFLRIVTEKLNSLQLSVKKNKTKFYGRQEYKLITGCSISPQGNLLIRNRLRKKAYDLIKNKDLAKLSDKDKKTALGVIQSAQMIEPKFFNSVKLKLKK